MCSDAAWLDSDVAYFFWLQRLSLCLLVGCQMPEGVGRVLITKVLVSYLVIHITGILG